MIGRTISHYTILEKLGEGGMGVVYKARDTRLGREVALKFLPHDLTITDEERSRFIHEAKSASALDHPGICTIYEIDETPEGRMFIVMGYYEGMTLSRRIRKGRLAVEEAAGIAIQVAEGLQAAHENGIVHRDIKSGNIVLTEKGQAKILDFGLARKSGLSKLTRTGTTVGTAAYMSPEQARGDRIDERSDLWSLGVVLYEMVTGSLPFRGEHEAAILYSVVNEEPQPLQALLPDASPELLHILGRTLEKDPAERYRSAGEMLTDLRRLRKESSGTGYRPVKSRSRRVRRRMGMYAAGLAAVLCGILYFVLGPGGTDAEPERHMLVVLPFDNLGPAEEEYFVDGLTEEITGKLSGLSGLGVISSFSAREYKQTTKSLDQIGEELGVDYVLQGKVQWDPKGGRFRVRVIPALIRVDDGTQVWSRPFNPAGSDFLSMQSDIAKQVAGALGVSILGRERELLEDRPTASEEAYDFYLRGVEYCGKSFLREDYDVQRKMFGRAVELDPEFAVAWARLSEVHAAIYWQHYDHTPGRMALAKEAVDRALDIDPLLPEAHRALGFYYFWYHLDYEGALEEMSIALKGKPSDGTLHMSIGLILRRQGKMDSAIVMIRKANEIDPRRPEYLFHIGYTYHLLHDYPSAEDYLRRAITLKPNDILYHVTLVRVALAADGTTKRARQLLGEASHLGDYQISALVVYFRINVELCDGRYSEALNIAGRYMTRARDDQFEYVPRTEQLGEIYTLMGDRVRAAACYDSARTEAERKIAGDSADSRFRSALGIALAGMGRKEEAITAGRKGMELLPVEREAWRGSYRMIAMARIFTMTGELDSAVAMLATLLEIPSTLGRNHVRTDPRWLPLRGHPGFEALVAPERPGRGAD